jgi:hypothetical protein
MTEQEIIALGPAFAVYLRRFRGCFGQARTTVPPGVPGELSPGRLVSSAGTWSAVCSGAGVRGTVRSESVGKGRLHGVGWKESTRIRSGCI